MSVLLGAIADDFTGATDLSNTLIGSGMHVVQTIGVPLESIDFGTANAVVVALKSRTAPVDRAVADSLAALRWLRELGARQFFFKYCSTFDSTSKGNIGPVADALLEELEEDFALICPAFPANSRTVYMGHLFIGDRLLSETPMKDHPLTPMQDANLLRLMDNQSIHRAGLIAYNVVSAGTEATERAIDSLRKRGIRYGVTDALSNDHLANIGSAARTHALITGGSAVAQGLAENFRQEGLLGAAETPQLPRVAGTAAILAGSCSQATRNQVACWQQNQHPVFKVDAGRIARGEPVLDEIVAWINTLDDQPLLIYSSDDPAEVRAVQKQFGRELASAAIEKIMGEIAISLVGAGRRKLILAGGETAGAVVSA
ncbi:MAG TPA: 3-oxo-tetronate kinase, partial [Woeseiaceae bacterium]